MEINSTYGIRTSASYKSESFFNVTISWRTDFEILKIRIATWKPKEDRSSQALFYFEVSTRDEAIEIIKKVSDYNFKKIENYFEKIYKRDSAWLKNTGETYEWLDNVIIPEFREKFKDLPELLNPSNK